MMEKRSCKNDMKEVNLVIPNRIHKITRKKVIKTIIKVSIIFILYAATTLIHEFGHMLGAWITGNGVGGMFLNAEKLSLFVEIEWYNNDGFLLVVAGGYLISCLLGFILMRLGNKKEKNILYLFGYAMIFKELLYAGLSVLIMYGDSHSIIAYCLYYNLELTVILYGICIICLIYSFYMIYKISCIIFDKYFPEPKY